MKPLKDYSRDELLSLIEFYRERERYFSQLLGVADAGQFRADWDARIQDLVSERDRLKVQLGSQDKSVIADNDTLRWLLERALPFINDANMKKAILKALKGRDEPSERVSTLRDALDTAVLDLLVFHSLMPDSIGTGEKVNLNWLLSLLGKPKRYSNVPEK